MEPRSFERGEDRAALEKQSDAALQWSHVLSNVERGVSGPGFPLVSARASMEPRSFERGEVVILSSLPPGWWLQWSHVLSNVERSGLLPSIVASTYARFNGATFFRTWRVA